MLKAPRERAGSPRRGEGEEALVPLVVDSGGRSGTTMTMSLLASSPQIALDREHPYEHPYEHRYLAWMVEWAGLAERFEWNMERWDAKALAGALEAAPPDGLVGPPPWHPRPLWEADGKLSARLLSAAWREFSAQAASRTARDRKVAPQEVRYHAEKTINLARLRELYPLAIRGLCLHRDPRDVWLSVQAFNRARGFPAFGRRPEEGEEQWFQRFLQISAKRLRATLAQREHPDSLLLAYEELIERPRETATRLGAWLGVQLDPQAPIRDLGRHGEHATSASPRASIGRWRAELSPERRERFGAAMGTELRELGYEV